MKSAVILPTFNEGERVLAVAQAAAANVNVGDIIVVNDGSTDNTSDLLARENYYKVITHPENRGKGEALDSGMQHAIDSGYESAIFLDADLQGIEPHHIDDLLEPLSSGNLMAIGYLGLRKTVIKKTMLQQWGALSGQRALKTEVWSLLNQRDKHGFNIEAALNARMRKNHLHHAISRVALDGLGHIGKHEKLGSWPKALWGYTKTYSAAWATYARIELGG
ncbi:MAG: glycosyltransferase [Candidatus Saccharibacteria bacterium]